MTEVSKYHHLSVNPLGTKIFVEDDLESHKESSRDHDSGAQLMKILPFAFSVQLTFRVNCLVGLLMART